MSFQKSKTTVLKEYDIEDFEITNEIERSYLKLVGQFTF
jgi:hypothetical protein